MTISIARTPAETALAERFLALAPELPGDPSVTQARSAAMGVFEALGLPHRRIEAYKYTDLRQVIRDVGAIGSGGERAAVSQADVASVLGPLAAVDGCRLVFVDGVFDEGLSAAELPKGVTLTPLSQALRSKSSVLAGRMAVPEEQSEAVLALNTAFMADGAVLRVDSGVELSAPMVIVNMRTAGASRWTTIRNVIEVGADARLSLIEAFVGVPDSTGGQTNAVTRVVIGDRAEVTHVKVALETASTHIASWSAEVGAETVYRPFFFTAGPAVARNNLFVTFAGERAKLDASGCYLGRGNDHIDNTLVIDHAVPGCESRELFKCVLDDRARGVFQGKVIVRRIAQKTDGKQMAQALMLSPHAEFDSKPELEIYADDVACGHGSTCDDLDPDLVFYLRARGIAEAVARGLLTESFVGEAIDRVQDDDIAEALQALAQGWLNKKAA